MTARHCPTIIQPGRNAAPTTRTAAAGVLVDCASYYRAFYRAALTARHYILMSGWQFDSSVALMRGDDAPPGEEVRFLRCLNGLCERHPALHVYILAWNFHLVFTPEREWLQRVVFHWMTNARFHFRFDDNPIAGGSHHQKFVVVDGALAFVGGADICESRWDDRRHVAVNPLRVSRGRVTKPYHEVQAYLVGGDAVAHLRDLFVSRWARAAGEYLALPSRDVKGLDLSGLHEGIAFGPTELAFSRTEPLAADRSLREIEQLFVDAIDAAESLIYLETQYFSSRRIYEALKCRIQAAERPDLDIVIVVNERAEAVKEELAVGLRQAKNLQGLRDVAAESGHKLGVYYSMCADADETYRVTYIHSKVAIVDDRFLTVGSANLTNRSLSVDSELHASWEAPAGSDIAPGLARSIRRVRVSLLAEHAGLSGFRAVRALARARGLVARLDRLAASGARLRPHGPPTSAQLVAMDLVDPQDLPFDPEIPPATAGSEPTDERDRRGVRRALGSAWARLRQAITPRRARRAGSSAA